MKWIVLCAATCTLPLFAMSKSSDPAEVREQQIKEKEKEPQPPPFDADLFKKDAEIYSIHAEFLYWTVAEGALDYALKMRESAWSTTTPSYAQGRYETAGYDVDPGFRIALVYFRAPHYWEVKWQYTRITFDGHDQVNKPDPATKYITGTWPQITFAPLASATSHIHLNYNVFDMNVDRVFFPNPHLRLRFIGGAVGAWINQDWKVRYSDSFPHSTTIQNKWSFAGAGLKTATMVDWYWTGELYMTAAGSFGLLIGDYHNKAKQSSSFGPSPGDNTSVPIRNASYHDIRPTFTTQMLLGPSWQKNYCNARVEVFAGFEMNMWLNLQEIYRSTAALPSEAKETWLNTGALTLYGLTTRLTVDF